MASLPAPRANARPVTVNQHFTSAELTSTLDVLEDRAGTLTIDEVRARPAAFEDGQKSLKFGYSKSVHWAHLAVTSESDRDETVFFELTYPALDEVTFYGVDRLGQPVVLKTGDNYAFESRKFQHTGFVYEIELKPGATSDLYIRVRSTSTVNMSSTLWSAREFSGSMTREHLILGLYFGCMLSMFVYNLFLVVSTRDRAYLYYCYFIGSTFLFFFSWNGLAFQYLWPESPGWANQSLPFFLVHFNVGSSLFSQEFLNLRQRLPRTNRAWRVLVGANLAAMMIGPLASVRIGILAVLALSLIEVWFIAWVTVEALYRRYRPGYFYAAGWIILGAGGTISTVATMGLLPMSGLTRYLSQISSALEVLLASFGLGDKLNQARRDRYVAKAKLSDNLERLVSCTRAMALSATEIEAGTTAATAICETVSELGAAAVDLVLDPELTTARVTRFIENGTLLAVPRDITGDLNGPPMGASEHAIESSGRSQLRISGVSPTQLAKEDAHFIGAVGSSLTVALEVIFQNQHLQELVDHRTADLKEALSRVVAEKDKMRFLLENMDEGLLSCNGDLVVTDEFSAAVSRFLEIPADGIRGKGLVELLLPDAAKRDRKSVV